MLVGGGPCEFLPWAPTVCRLTTGFTALLKLNYFSCMPSLLCLKIALWFLPFSYVANHSQIEMHSMHTQLFDHYQHTIRVLKEHLCGGTYAFKRVSASLEG